MVLCTELPTDYHHNSIIELSVCWCVWKVGEGLPGRVLPKTLKWVADYSSVTFHINGLHSDRSALCYCEGVGCHVLCLWRGIPVWQHIGQSTTATSRHRQDMTSDV